MPAYFSAQRYKKVCIYAMFFQKNARFTCVCALFLLTLQAIRNVVTPTIGGISTSVVHRLPKPRRRVRFPYAALRRNSLVAIKSLCDLGRPQLLLLPRAHEALGRMLGIRSRASRFARRAWGMSLYERGGVPAGGKGCYAAVYGQDSTPAKGA